MGLLDKDIRQKEYAIRFCVLTGSVPFLEVNVENRRELSDATTVITDIDVLGVSLDPGGRLRRLIFDCKTLGNTSPINRAFWAAGLMRYTGSDEAFIVLRKKATEAHRLSAKEINVHLFDEKQFFNYASSYSLSFMEDYCYSTNIESWVLLHNSINKVQGFDKYGQFLTSELPLERDPARGIKRMIAALQKGRGEFNPQRPIHVAIYFQSVMMFCYLMAKVVHDLKAVIDFDASKNDFERILRYYIWGGRDAYSQKQKLSQLFSEATGSSAKIDSEIPEWDSFIELARKLLDSPADVFNCCHPMQELAIRSIVDKTDIKEQYLVNIISKNKRVRQFVTALGKYLIAAAKLPTEFALLLSQSFDELNERI